MPDERTRATGSVGIAPSGSRRYLRFAWISVAFIPVAFVAAFFIGEGLITVQGYESGADELPPLGATLLAAVPAVLVMIAPAVAAVVFGLRARQRGYVTGIFPAVIGIVVVACAIVANTLPLLFAR